MQELDRAIRAEYLNHLQLLSSIMEDLGWRLLQAAIADDGFHAIYV